MGINTKVFLSALLLAATLGAQEQEKKLTKRELPAAVLSAFQKSYPKAGIKGIAEEKKEGKTYYEIESLDGKVSRDLLYNADGSVAEIEESMAVVNLPEAVKSSVEARFPKAEITKAEKVTKGAALSYSLALRTAKGKLGLELDAAGKILKEEKPEGKGK